MPTLHRVLEFAFFRCSMEGLYRFGFCKAAGLGRPTCLPFACQIPLDMPSPLACCMLIYLCMLTQLLGCCAPACTKHHPFLQACTLVQACFCCCMIERICMLQQCMLPAASAAGGQMVPPAGVRVRGRRETRWELRKGQPFERNARRRVS